MHGGKKQIIYINIYIPTARTGFPCDHAIHGNQGEEGEFDGFYKTIVDIVDVSSRSRLDGTVAGFGKSLDVLDTTRKRITVKLPIIFTW